MKIKRLALIAMTTLLSSCSLGAEVISKEAFKKILQEEVAPLVVNSVLEHPAYYSLTDNVRNIQQKIYEQSIYEIEGSAFAQFKTTEGLNKNLEVKASKSLITNVTKEIINSAGIKTFSDVEKTNVTTSYTFDNEINTSTNEHKLVAEKEVVTITVYTDYLSIELDPITGNIASSEIIVGDDVYGYSTEKVVFDTFEKQGASSGDSEEEEDDEAVVVSLQGTTWNLSDSTGAYKTATIDIKTDADSIVSKNISVGTIKVENATHNLYMFEKGDSSYYFEIRHETKVEEKTTIDTTVYENNQNAYANVVLPKINEFLGNADVLEIENAIFDTYAATYNFMNDEVNSGKTTEILSRPSGLVFRVIENGVLEEVLISKKDEDTNCRLINSVVRREGFDGNIITSQEFGGFKF